MTDQTLDWDTDLDIKAQTTSYFLRGMRTLWRLIAVEHKRILLSVGILLVVEFLGLAVPMLFRELVDYLPTIRTDGFTLKAGIIIGLMFGVRIIALVLKRFVQEPLFLRAIIRLENYWPRIAQEKLLALSIRYHERENTGRKIAKVNKGTEKMTGMLADLFWGLLPALFYLLINTFIIFVLDWRLAILFVLPLIPAVWINLKSYQRFYPSWQEYEAKKEESIGLFCQSIINVRTVQAFVGEGREAKNLRAVRSGMETLDTSICITLQRYFFAMEAVLGVCFLFTIITGLYFVYRDWSTIGTVAYLFITGNVALQNLWGMIHVYTRMLRDLVAAERMDHLLASEIDVKNDAPGVVPTLSQGSDIVVQGVSLRYPGKQNPVLKDFTLTVASGEMLALVGKSGAGKSTVVGLLARVFDPTEGIITLGDVDIRTVDRDWYRRRFAFVPQDVEIFDGTIRQNILYAHPDADETLVLKGIEAACLTEVTSDPSRFPQGLNTEVGERGVRLSGGERQRVGIARAYVALLSGAQVLILDEATSSLDSQSEQVVQKFVEQLRQTRDITIVAIAHRLSTIRKADRICVLDTGQIVEMGDHNQLLRRNGLYKRLVRLQELGDLRE